MLVYSPDFLNMFGKIRFAEESSAFLIDYSRAFKKYFKKKSPYSSGYFTKFGMIDFAEIGNQSTKDFKKGIF